MAAHFACHEAAPEPISPAAGDQQRAVYVEQHPAHAADPPQPRQAPGTGRGASGALSCRISSTTTTCVRPRAGFLLSPRREAVPPGQHGITRALWQRMRTVATVAAGKARVAASADSVLGVRTRGEVMNSSGSANGGDRASACWQPRAFHSVRDRGANCHAVSCRRRPLRQRTRAS